MKILVDDIVFDSHHIEKKGKIKIKSDFLKDDIHIPDSVAYPPFINSHDHLVGNWYPRTGDNRPYASSDIWIEDMKYSKPYLERNKVWINDGKFDLCKGNAYLLTSLGIYKNIFSGCNVVQDHVSKQNDKYYESFPIFVIKDYAQCHSISVGNWWGDKTAEEGMEDSQGKMPFILHLAEGTDKKAKEDFTKLKKRNLLRHNTVMVHAIALTEEEIKETAEVGASICWCPESNEFLIGKSIDVPASLKYGVNVLLGTDSTQSGSINFFHEIRAAHKMFPQIPLHVIFDMFTVNAQKAMFLNESFGRLSENGNENILVLDKLSKDPFENLIKVDSSDVVLQLYKGKPIFGNYKYLKHFDIDENEYFIFDLNGIKKFVIGHPEKTIETIDSYLGYHKKFPFIPFT